MSEVGLGFCAECGSSAVTEEGLPPMRQYRQCRCGKIDVHTQPEMDPQKRRTIFAQFHTDFDASFMCRLQTVGNFEF